MQKLKEFLLKISIVLLIGFPLTISAQNIYWLESKFDSPRLVKSDTSGSELLSKSLTAGSLPQSIVLDEENNHLFWTGLPFINAQINKISTDFNTSSVVVDTQTVLRGIAVDPINGKIYWTSTNLVDGPKIWRADLDGQSQTALIDFGPASNSTPRSIALDIAAGKMYWTNFAEGKIQRANMADGASAEDVISGLDGPSGIAVDADSGKIYWTEMNGHQIKSADLNGNDITLLVDDLSYPGYISVNRSLNRMAWTEMGTGEIKSAALDGTDIFEYKVAAYAPTGVILETPPPISGDLAIIPSDTTIQIQNFAQFNAQLVDAQAVTYPVDANWFVKEHPVGAISNEGLFFAFFPGEAKIQAKYDTMSVKSHLTAIDTTADSSGVNKVRIVWKLFGREFELKTIKEGETFVIGGIPHRFNILNAAMVYFPFGSLHEDITLEFKLPDFCKIKIDTVEFANNIINGIQFHVYSGDSLVEPYYFDKPVSVSIPFRRGILRRLGINPENLGMFFATDSVNFDTLGISHVMVDSSRNRIYGLVEHFSSLVVREKVTVTVVNLESTNETTPERFFLKQNYPNPFNPTTTIRYQLAKSSTVDLSIYNMLGQKISTLISGKQQAGMYNIQWDASGFASGVYFYKLETDQGFNKTRKLLLLK